MWDFVHVTILARCCNFNIHNLALWADVCKAWGSIPIPSIPGWVVVTQERDGLAQQSLVCLCLLCLCISFVYLCVVINFNEYVIQEKKKNAS